jgi:hypothetical protein
LRDSLALCDQKQQRRLAAYALSALAIEVTETHPEAVEEARQLLRDIFGSANTHIKRSSFWNLGSPMQLFIHSYTFIRWKKIHKPTVSTLFRLFNVFQEALKCYVSKMLLLGLDIDSLIEMERGHWPIKRPWPLDIWHLLEGRLQLLE